MRSIVCLASLALLVTGTAVGLDRSGTIMEVKVYFDNTRTLDRLGDLAGELDICTWDEDERGGYLIINTDDEQLARLQACGLRTEITWSDIREKFRYITGVNPDDLDAGRDFGVFLTYWEVQDTLNYLASTYPTLCNKYNAGNSHQGRALWVLKISDNPTSAENEPALFINGATHGREPLGTHACILFAEKILSEYGRDSIATWLVNNREIFIIPVMNPDGYVYNSDSGGASSNWRKNRRSPVPPAIGIDLNRNYGFKWGYDNTGSSPTPSAETYRGPSRFSEPETRVAEQFFNLNRFRTCMDYHTYGQYNLYPWGYVTTFPPEQALLQEMVDTFRVSNAYAANRTGQISRVLYGCNGVSVDWEYADTAGKFVSYAFTCELGTTDFWYGYNNASYVLSECNKNIPCLYYLARVSGVYFEPVSVTVSDSSGNNNGQLDPGEAANIWFTIRNRAIHPLDSAYQVSAKLVSRHVGVTVLDSVKQFPSCARRSSTHNSAQKHLVRADPGVAPGTKVQLRLEISYRNDGKTYTIPVAFEITVGSNPVAIEEAPYVTAPSLRVYPNPARGRVLFQLAQGGPARLEIYSSAGARVLSRELTDRLSIDCSSLPAGVYFCRLENAAGVSRARLNIAD